MKDVEVDVESMTDGELSAALRARGAPYGPIGPSTRAVYEMKLRKVLLNSNSTTVPTSVEISSSEVPTSACNKKTRQKIAGAYVINNGEQEISELKSQNEINDTNTTSVKHPTVRASSPARKSQAKEKPQPSNNKEKPEPIMNQEKPEPIISKKAEPIVTKEKLLPIIDKERPTISQEKPEPIKGRVEYTNGGAKPVAQYINNRSAAAQLESAIGCSVTGNRSEYVNDHSVTGARLEYVRTAGTTSSDYSTFASPYSGIYSNERTTSFTSATSTTPQLARRSIYASRPTEQPAYAYSRPNLNSTQQPAKVTGGVREGWQTSAASVAIFVVVCLVLFFLLQYVDMSAASSSATSQM